MTDNNFEYKMWDLKLRIKPSDDAVDRLKSLEWGGSRTSVGKRIIRAQIAAILLLILMIPTVAFAGYSIAQIIFEQTKDAGITEKEREQIQWNFEERGIITYEGIKAYGPLKRNEYGQTYGPDVYNPDLISVILDNDEIGYVYAEDLYLGDQTASQFKTPEEALAWRKEVDEIVEKQGYYRKIPVYASDGKTVIGEFYI